MLPDLQAVLVLWKQGSVDIKEEFMIRFHDPAGPSPFYGVGYVCYGGNDKRRREDNSINGGASL
jgi:hypothetical protein